MRHLQEIRIRNRNRKYGLVHHTCGVDIRSTASSDPPSPPKIISENKVNSLGPQLAEMLTLQGLPRLRVYENVLYCISILSRFKNFGFREKEQEVP